MDIEGNEPYEVTIEGMNDAMTYDEKENKLVFSEDFTKLPKTLELKIKIKDSQGAESARSSIQFLIEEKE